MRTSVHALCSESNIIIQNVSPEDEVLLLEVLGIDAALTDCSLDTGLWFKSVQVEIENPLDFSLKLFADTWLDVLAHGPSRGEVEGEGGESEEKASENQKG